jgi:hypothetical protein
MRKERDALLYGTRPGLSSERKNRSGTGEVVEIISARE